MGTTMGTAIILNGASSAGKSTTARYIQKFLDYPYIHWDAVAQHFMELENLDHITTSKYFADYVKDVLHDHGDAVIDLIIDGYHLNSWQCMGEYEGFTVKIFAPLDVLLAREQTRTDRPPERDDLIIEQHEKIYRGEEADFEIDSSVYDPETVARHIMFAYQDWKEENFDMSARHDVQKNLGIGFEL